MRRWWVGLIFGTAVAAAGCGTGGSTPGTTADLPDAVPDGTVPVEVEEVVPGDPGDDSQDRLEPDPAECLDACGQDEGAPDEGGCTGPGCAGQPCESNDDCLSAFCAETPDGKRCARPCTDGSTCDPGHECVQVSAYGDMLYVCVHGAPRTCRPCVSAEDCVGTYGTAAMLCERLGGFGFCVAECEDAADCGGAGWSCVEARDGKRCAPDGGTCPCSGRHADEGVKGACFRTNDVGTCEGRFGCLAEGGIGDCDAPEAAAEACNALDDDCDGETDEDFVTAGECDLENEHGLCKGAWVCKDGAQACEGRPPMPEVCNGIDDECDGVTDEGFADMDADGLADCVDPDVDGDGAPNETDVCPYLADPDQLDNDHDGDGDACDADDDNDKVIDPLDNCPFVPNLDQIDIDHDGAGDACDTDIDGDGVGNPDDNCPYVPNPGQEDANSNGVGDACDQDADGDGVPNAQDVCPLVADPAQLDYDHDGRGDACDCDADNDGVQNPAPGCPTACEKCDNCPLVPNPKQLDTDADGLGDACDDDADGDGVPNGEDNCPGTPNPDQLDSNGNGLGDACEGDWDGDGVKNAVDLCPWVPDPGQEDMDKDGEGDACDCDIDGDGLSNAGEDPDGNECVPTAPADNCPDVANPGQDDLDGDGIGDACDPDRDGDKDPDATDCAPGDPWVHHGAPESCNGVDDNCNGVTDDPDATGCTLRYWDGDGDGAGTLVAKCLCEAGGGFTAEKPGDCNDADPAVHPGATEVCANWRDDDCDAQVDEPNASGCAVLHKDADGDGYGADADSMCLCAPWNGYVTPTGGDCNDLDKGVFPGQVESCNGKDDDCDGSADGTGSAGCTQFLLDADRDGFGNDADKLCLCKPTAPYDAVKGGDCDDDAATSNPAAPEKCNSVDDDCDGATDEQAAAGCKEHYMDGDGDGYGALAASKCLCAPAAPYTSTDPTDCNDADAAVSPGATEACNGIDDDCDGQADEQGAAGCETYWRDNDGDAYGVESDSRCLCAPSGKYVASATGDCNDSDKAVYPGATELCNGKDDDCAGGIDEEGAQGCTSFYRDEDEDGWGVSTDFRCLCGPGGGYGAEKGGDCDDAAATVHPGAAELCNGADDDCDGAADAEGAAGCVTWWKDGDKDGYGDPGATKCLCTPGGIYTAADPGDCDDSDPLVNAGGTEKCGNSKDDDCNGFVDEEGAEGCASYWIDEDKDLWGTGTPKCLCTALGTYSATKPGDCADGDATINPGLKETCANGKDDNCNGAADEEGAIGCKPHYLDGDGDKYGQTAVTKCLCAPAGGYVASGGDCDDTDSTRNPGVTEKCATLHDDDCDGVANERNAVGCLVYYWDADEDGYGTSGRCYCQPTSNYTAPVPGDCNDSLATVNPGVKEACNGKDDDCDAATDEENADGCIDYYVDGDNDGWGSTVKKCLCAASGIYTTSKGGDCRDDDAAIHPGQTEICNGGRDDNCDGAADPEGTLGCQVWYLDMDRDGWGDSGASKCLCLPSPGTYDASKGGDCLDADPAITGCRTFYMDADGDGWGKDTDSKCLCAAIGNYRAVKGLDCDDALASVNPVAPETCNGRDDDCDAQVDEESASGCAQWWQDLDGDGWGGAGPKCLCAASGFYKAANGGDCLDSDAGVNPGRKEWCFPLDGKDNDCSGTADDNRLIRLVRLDYSDIDDPTAPSILQAHLESLGYQVILESIPPKKLTAIADLSQVTFLWIHGHDAFSLPAAHRTLLADYVNGGGTLFADDGNPGAWGDASAFMTSLLAEMVAAFGGQGAYLSESHPLFTAHYLLAGGAPPTEWSAETRVRAIDVGGEAGVIMTKNDYGSGLEDATAGWCYDNSLKMTTNVAVYALRKACQ